MLIVIKVIDHSQ